MDVAREYQCSEDDDGVFFRSHPDREYRIRRAFSDSHRVHVALQRHDIGQLSKYVFFSAPPGFRTNRTDDEIREIIARVRLDPVISPEPCVRDSNLFKSMRARAWRNASVAGINAGLEQGLFGLQPGQNFWAGAADSRAAVYRFTLGEIPAIASVSDSGFDELKFQIAIWPTDDAEQSIAAAFVGLRVGELFALSWLERRDGAWLQVPRATRRDNFVCRRHRLETVTALEIEPSGYVDNGRFML